MRVLILLTVCGLAACEATETSPSALTADVASTGDTGSAIADAVDAQTPDVVSADPDADTFVPDAAATDVAAFDSQETVDTAAPSDVVSHMLLTDSAGEAVFLDASFIGYEPYVFGAEVYGDLLKLWASEGDTKIEFLIRLNQHDLPGSITPGAPGEDAWVLLMLGEENAYVTQTSSGTIQLDVCPETKGLLLTGQFEGIPMYSMSGLSTANFKVNGTFELLLGSVEGPTYCQP